MVRKQISGPLPIKFGDFFPATSNWQNNRSSSAWSNLQVIWRLKKSFCLNQKLNLVFVNCNENQIKAFKQGDFSSIELSEEEKMLDEYCRANNIKI